MRGARIVARGLGVCFQLDRSQRVVTPAMARLLPRGDETWGLRDIDLHVDAGEAVGLVGRSGSGKTTLLRAVAGVLRPDEGELAVRGRVGSLLSVQAGLLSRLTGAENAVLLAVLSGLSRREALAALPLVRERSGLGRAFDHPVISYSQGMRARLGFAAADCADPDILLLDEVHEALDHEFRARVEQRASEICAAGGIVVAAGHDHALLARMCSRVVALDEGGIVADGSAVFDAARGELGVGASGADVTPFQRRAQGVG